MNKNKITTIILGITLAVTASCLVVDGVSISKLNGQIKQLEQKQEGLQNENSDLKSNIEGLQKDKEQLNESNEQLQEDNAKLKDELEKAKKTAAEQARSLSISRGLVANPFTTSSNVYTKSGITAKHLDRAFVDTKMAGLGSAFINAEKETGVNAIFLAAIAALESGWGSSNFAGDRNNLFGFGSYDYDTKSTVRFGSKEQCILTVAQALKRDYLDVDGQFYNGPTPGGVNVKYCTSATWDNQVADIMNIIVNRIAK